jgi:hypothetical protein
MMNSQLQRFIAMRTTILTTLAAVDSVSAQRGDRPTPDADRLRCGIDSLAVSLLRQGSRQRTGIIVDECRSSGTGNARLMTRIYRTTDAALGDRLDTIVDVWSSLAPRSYRSRTSREVVQLDWTQGRLRGNIQTDGKAASTVNEDATAGVYNSASFDVILRASPLATGYALALPAYVPGRGIATLTANVVGDEPVDGQSSWRVDADFSGLAVTFWIAKNSRQLLKQVIHVAPGIDIEFVALTRAERE